MALGLSFEDDAAEEERRKKRTSAMSAPSFDTSIDTAPQQDEPASPMDVEDPWSSPDAPASTSPKMAAPSFEQPAATKPKQPRLMNAPADPAVERIKTTHQQLQQETDPARQAVLRDTVARDVASSLKGSGHDVQWQGDQLIVDGRPYTIAGGNSASTQASTRPSGSSKDAFQTAVKSGARGEALIGALHQAGFTQEKGQYYPDTGYIGFETFYAVPDGNGGYELTDRIPYSQRRPSMAPRPGIDAPGADSVDWNTAAPTSFEPKQAIPPNQTFPGPGRLPPTPQPRQVAGPDWEALGAGGPDWVRYGDGWVPPNHPHLSQGPIDEEVTPLPRIITEPPPESNLGGWQAGGPTYQPGEIDMDDLEGYDVDDTLDRIGGPINPQQLQTSFEAGRVTDNLDGYSLEELRALLPASGDLPQLDASYDRGRVTTETPDTYQAGELDDLGDLDGGPVLDETEARLMELLKNPSSLDDRTVAMLKARTREGFAEASEEEDRQLQAFATKAGLDDSRWLASERAGNVRNRDEATLGGYRDIDLEAAATRGADARSAIQLGGEFGNQQAANQRATAALKMQRELEQQGLNQAEIASKMQAAGFARESEIINEELRGQAFDRSNAATQQNIQNRLASEAGQRQATDIATSRSLQAASFEQQGELANEQLRGEAFDRVNAATQQNINNLFKSREEHRASVALANDTALKAATLKGDRLALRESINQKAAELGIAADKLQLDYTLGLLANAMEKYGIDTQAATARRGQDKDAETSRYISDQNNATQRYGIDVGAALDREKLAQAGREFQEELAYKLAALAQADAQFGASYGLNWQQFLHDVDQDDFDNNMRLLED
jgi:hypothetical protein